MRSADPAAAQIDPELRDEVVAFLREWLPAAARESYRRMIRENPEGWHRDPHFEGGIILNHALRGNGIDEAALGVRDLGVLWPDLLRRAVSEEGAG